MSIKRRALILTGFSSYMGILWVLIENRHPLNGTMLITMFATWLAIAICICALITLAGRR